MSRRLTGILPRQEIIPWFKSKERPSLDSAMQISSLTDESALLAQTTRQFIINASRCSIAENREETQFTWAAANALLTEKSSPMKKIAFLPVIPHSVTSYSAVYSASRNFEDMGKQLGQEYFPVVADEGVYQVIMDIVLSHPEEFPKLFPMMGIFHMAKVALHCAGKYFKGSGIDTALILAAFFGKNTIESVLSGRHYIRS